jgi:hypothetical protein
MFRGLLLHYLEKAHAAGELNFFSAHRHLHEPAALRRHLDPVRDTEWVVYGRLTADLNRRIDFEQRVAA